MLKGVLFFYPLQVYYISYMSTAPGRSYVYPGAEHAHTIKKYFYFFEKGIDIYIQSVII